MANVIIGSPNFSDLSSSAQPNLYTPALSGGSWESGNPLTNLQSRKLHLVARSTNDARTSTLFTADLGANRPVRVVALAKHTISDVNPVYYSNNSGPQVRVRGFTSPPILDAGGDGYSAFGSGWTSVGTPTRSANAAAADNGVYLDLIGDDDGGGFEYYERPIAYTGNAQKVVEVYWKAGTAVRSFVTLYDSTAVQGRLEQYITNSGGVPSVTQTVGTLVSSTAIGNGVYRLVFLTTSVTAANTNALVIYPAHNGAAADTGNVHIGNVCTYDAATDPLVYDSGMVRVHPAGSTAETRAGLNATFVTTVPENTSGRYWRVNINDDNNPAGYVDIGRLIIAGGYQPTFNFSVGATVTTESETTRTVTDGGAAIYDTRPLRRIARFAIDNLEANEAWLSAWRVMKRLGASNQCFLVLDPDADAETMAETAFLCVPRELSVLEYTAPMFRSLGFAFTEEL
jgi:hypothetical protein